MYYNEGTRDLSPLEEGDVVRMRPFGLGQEVWQKATVTKQHDERSYEVESESGTYRRNRVDLRAAAYPTEVPRSNSCPNTSSHPKQGEGTVPS